MGIYEELEWRGLLKDCSSPELREKLNAGGMTFYIGTDPTGDSLHIGHFSSFLISKRLKDAGHHPILLVGGGTGLIGDPKPDSERPMITKEEVDHNFNCLKNQVEKLFGFGHGQGYPKERVIPEQRNKKILDAVRAETLRPLTECLDRIDQELLKGAIAGENFSELFFANCKDEKLASYIRKLLK